MKIKHKYSDKEGNICLGQEHANKQWQITELENGSIILTPITLAVDEDIIDIFNKAFIKHKKTIDALKDNADPNKKDLTQDQKDYLLATSILKENNPRTSLEEVEERLNTKSPNKKTKAAMHDADTGNIFIANSIETLFASLNENFSDLSEEQILDLVYKEIKKSRQGD